MKTSIAILFCTAGIFALVDSSSAFSGTHKFLLGGCTDKVFAREDVKKNAINSYESVTEVKTFSTDGKARITMIEAIDLKKNGSTVKVLNGGIGQTFITLQFESPPGHGLHFKFEMYAKYENKIKHY